MHIALTPKYAFGKSFHILIRAMAVERNCRGDCLYNFGLAILLVRKVAVSIASL